MLTPSHNTALDRAFAECLSEAKEAWPALASNKNDEAFIARLAQVVPEEEPLAALAGLKVCDLYLSTACSLGDETAVVLCEKHYLGALHGPLARFQNALAIDEALQAIRCLLFLGTNDRGPKIGEYAGRGEFGAWLRVVAIRTAISILRKGNKEVCVGDEQLAGMQDESDDPELLTLKARYREDFRCAFEEGIAVLDARDRTLLRLQYIDGLTIDAIGAMYGVHRATAARWLVKVRDTVHDHTRDALTARLDLAPGEVASIVRLVQSQLDVSIRKFLVSSQG